MTSQAFRLRLTRVNQLKLKVSARVPAQIEALTPIVLEKTNGAYTLSLDANALSGTFATAAQGALADTAVQSVVAGSNVTVDNTDPRNPVVSASGGGGGGSGDVTGPSSAVDSEIALFSSTTGKVIKRASTTGILKASSGVLSAATSGTDYAPATSGSAILKGNGSGGFSNATAGTDYYNPGGTDVAIADGGTGASTAAAAFDALAPTTTRGDLIFRNASTNTRLAASTAGYHLQTNGAASDPTYVGFLQVGTGATTRTWQDKGRDVVSIKDFGCVGDDSTDNVTTLATAITAAAAGDFNLYVPAGIFRTSGAHTLPANVSLIGSGRYVSVFKTTSATATLFATSGTGVSLKSLGFASSVVRSAGSFVEINNGLFELSDFVMNGPFIGITFQSSQRTILVENGEITDAVATTGQSMKFVNAGTDVSVNDVVCTINNTAARPAAHIALYLLADLSMSDIQMYGAVNNMTITPGSGQGISSLKCVNVWFDQASSHNLLVQPTSDGFFKRSSFIGCWFSGSVGGSGAIIFPSGASTSVDGIDFTDCEFLSNAGSGFFTGGTAGTMSNIQIIGGRVAGNTNQGILFDGVLGGQIQNVRIGPAGGYGGANGVGVYLAGAADNINVSGNDLRGNTATLTNAASGTHNRITDNVGLNPIGAAAVTTGASPWTFTAGPYRTTLYASASTSMTAVTQGGVSILPAATGANVPISFQLEPNEAIIITYTGTLTAKKMEH